MESTKDPAILQIISYLQQKFGKGSFSIADYWDADLCAVGLVDNSGRYLLYLNTYGKPKGTFHAELEDNAITDNTNRPTQVFETLGIEKLENVFRQYFITGKS
jgi:hypothetical protein